MKRLAIHHLSHTPPKSAVAADVRPPTLIDSASLSRRPFFPVCPQSRSLYLHAFRIRYSTKFIKISSSYQHQMATGTPGESATPSSPAVVKLKPIEATPESFQEFGQVVEASPDGDEFGPRDAQLDLSHGIPRFYIMHLEDRPLKFSTITHHASVTQCLGSIGGHVWYLGVAKPSILDPIEIKGTVGADVVQSHCGHFYLPPAIDDVRVFRISGPKFLKLNRGTWHAGPLFLEKTMDFYNLELSNTNVVDHTTHNFVNKNKVVFSIGE
ncbi:uncharacterized protein LOC105180210 [Sesamum indicum]|uniref:Uncharacterized protein LOC105180210 n=1 Tax=Sesamum indicum TaxID=4182 RepID=A0A6I9UJN6_SESIN|nr:uncharacterized protein LOC105180210 [Sesamum indicum]